MNSKIFVHFYRVLARRTGVRAGVMALLLLTAGAARAADSPGGTMPLETRERLWSQPGPEQGEGGAPRLLIVYPLRNGAPEELKVARYAGRVEPATSTVTLNGQALTVYPGGVFTGTRPLGGAGAESWLFEAVSDGKKTTVERILRQPAKAVPPPAWPLAFGRPPVSPAGDCWLKSGDTLKITLYASPGQHAQARVGVGGAWKPMSERGRDPERGGIYTLELAAPKPRPEPELQPVQFRISGNAGGESQSRELTSALRVATLPEGRQLWGRVTANLGTFLKNGAASDWARWGNWVRGTPFPILEGRGDRLRTGFGRGESGWVEDASVTLDRTYQRRTPAALGTPRITVGRQTLTLAWPAVKTPVACVFYPAAEPAGGTGNVLRISLPGAGSLKKFTKELPGGGAGDAGDGGFLAVTGTDGNGKEAAAVTVRLARPLWGYAMRCTEADGLRILVRTRPAVGDGEARPLAGLRVMLDAGHGGSSFGERGPSGLLEKDINLVQAAWLEKDLEALGAEVRQIRRGDEDVDLDARVDRALAWPPDLFISLHHNSVAASQDPLSDSGPIVFYHYPHSQPLAAAVAGAMAEQLAAEHGARARANTFRVNRNVSLCPSVLVESAYLCNPADEYKLRQTETLKASAQAIAAGVARMFNDN